MLDFSLNVCLSLEMYAIGRRLCLYIHQWVTHGVYIQGIKTFFAGLFTLFPLVEQS